MGSLEDVWAGYADGGVGVRAVVNAWLRVMGSRWSLMVAQVAGL